MQTEIDRDKMLNALQDMCDYFNGCAKNAQPGSVAYNRFGRYVDALSDALALLKAQEPVRPVTGLWDRDIQLFNCGACGGEIGAGGIAKYCFHCGRAVKWDA